MEKSEFIKAQYITLREEIKDTKSRIFKIVSYGLIVVPAAHFLAQSYQLDAVILSLPLLVIVVALLYLSENHALMRCGCYIRSYIEPQVKEYIGWEKWLESANEFDPRSVDKYVNYCIYLLYFVYYAGSIFVASRFALINYNVIAFSLILGGYFAIGIWFLLFLVKNIRTTTSTNPNK